MGASLLPPDLVLEDVHAPPSLLTHNLTTCVLVRKDGVSNTKRAVKESGAGFCGYCALTLLDRQGVGAGIVGVQEADGRVCNPVGSRCRNHGHDGEVAALKTRLIEPREILS
jgi:hypothetical protein